LRAASRAVVRLCHELDLLGGETIALDGSFFNASARDASLTTKQRLEAQLKQPERDLDADIQTLEVNDPQEDHTGAGFDNDPAFPISRRNSRRASRHNLISWRPAERPSSPVPIPMREPWLRASRL